MTLGILYAPAISAFRTHRVSLSRPLSEQQDTASCPPASHCCRQLLHHFLPHFIHAGHLFVRNSWKLQRKKRKVCSSFGDGLKGRGLPRSKHRSDLLSLQKLINERTSLGSKIKIIDQSLINSYPHIEVLSSLFLFPLSSLFFSPLSLSLSQQMR